MGRRLIPPLFIKIEIRFSLFLRPLPQKSAGELKTVEKALGRKNRKT